MLPMPDIKSLLREELEPRLREWGEAPYRASQLLNWLYARRATAWEKMSNLPAKLRQRLAEQFTLHILELVKLQGARDATQKFLWRLHDHALVESVLIPASPALYGEPSDRHTLCISAQVGCAYGCKFCASGLEGWKRHLTADEIVEQVLATERWHEQTMQEASRQPAAPEGDSAGQTEEATGPSEATPSPPSGERAGVRGQPMSNAVTPTLPPPSRPPLAGVRLADNVVIMGMGEPLANYENLMRAVRILNAPWGAGIGARKITVSTSGLAPEIRRLAEEPLQIRLAVSLHAPTDAIRNRLMPVNRRYPLRELVAACEHYLEKKGRMITFEYILIAGINDAPALASPLAALAHRLHAQVNLIPYNHVEGLAWQRPPAAAQEKFLAALLRLGAKATLRVEKGGDIDAACGQLRLKTERELHGRHAG
jgi:23S rRNA (adenine2503-C2)-methyltransferase